MQQMHAYRPQKMYVFDQGWRSLRSVTTRILDSATKSSSQLFGLSTGLFSQGENIFFMFFAWALGILLALIGIVLFCLIFLVALVFATICASALLLSMGGCLLLIGLLTLYSRLYTRYFGIHYRCPNVYCYHEMPLPLFLCDQDQCRKPHTALRPSIYGIFYHCCACGNKLPTLDHLGRDKIERICANRNCGVPLDKEIGRSTNIDIPIIGGRLAGKTTYLVTAISMLKAHYKDYTISFTNERYRQQFEDSFDKLQKMQMVKATVDEAPHAYTLTFARPGARVPKLLFFYDAAGEAFAKNEKMYSHSYYNYIRGIIFIIDPCAISAFNRTHSEEIESLGAGLAPSTLNVEEIGNRLVTNIEMRRGIRRAHKIPLAVVVTKVDALGVEDEINHAIQKRLEDTSSSYTPEEAANMGVRDFLCTYGLEHLTGQLEYYFSPVHYFSCSSLGTTPTPSGYRFAPIRVLEPLQWLLSQNDAI